jgi:predicted nuclease with TOPRIM domain
MWFFLFLILTGSLPLIYLWGRSRGTAFYQHLSDLRLNAADVLRFQVREYAQLFHRAEQEVDVVIQGIRFLQVQHAMDLDRNLVQINEGLAKEYASLFDYKEDLEMKLTNALRENRQVEPLTQENIELRVQNREFEELTNKLKARSKDLEDALNLETISSWANYSRERLMKEMDGIRQHLNRILTPA